MTELVVTLFRLGYLALLWILVLSAIAVLRRDLYGTRVVRRTRRAAPPTPAPSPAPYSPVLPPTPVIGPLEQGPAYAPEQFEAAAQPAPRRQTQGSKPERPASRGPRTPSRGVAVARLVVISGELRGTTIPLGTTPIVVGRAPSCTLVIDDAYTSSRHARIFPQAGEWVVEDLGSTNGTFLDDERVEAPTVIRPGVPVRVGQCVLELQR